MSEPPHQTVSHVGNSKDERKAIDCTDDELKLAGGRKTFVMNLFCLIKNLSNDSNVGNNVTAQWVGKGAQIRYWTEEDLNDCILKHSLCKSEDGKKPMAALQRQFNSYGFNTKKTTEDGNLKVVEINHFSGNFRKESTVDNLKGFKPKPKPKPNKSDDKTTASQKTKDPDKKPPPRTITTEASIQQQMPEVEKETNLKEIDKDIKELKEYVKTIMAQHILQIKDDIQEIKANLWQQETTPQTTETTTTRNMSIADYEPLSFPSISSTATVPRDEIDDRSICKEKLIETDNSDTEINGATNFDEIFDEHHSFRTAKSTMDKSTKKPDHQKILPNSDNDQLYSRKKKGSRSNSSGPSESKKLKTHVEGKQKQPSFVLVDRDTLARNASSAASLGKTLDDPFIVDHLMRGGATYDNGVGHNGHDDHEDEGALTPAPENPSQTPENIHTHFNPPGLYLSPTNEMHSRPANSQHIVHSYAVPHQALPYDQFTEQPPDFTVRTSSSKNRQRNRAHFSLTLLKVLAIVVVILLILFIYLGTTGIFRMPMLPITIMSVISVLVLVLLGCAIRLQHINKYEMASELHNVMKPSVWKVTAEMPTPHGLEHQELSSSSVYHEQAKPDGNLPPSSSSRIKFAQWYWQDHDDSHSDSDNVTVKNGKCFVQYSFDQSLQIECAHYEWKNRNGQHDVSINFHDSIHDSSDIDEEQPQQHQQHIINFDTMKENSTSKEREVYRVPERYIVNMPSSFASSVASPPRQQPVANNNADFLSAHGEILLKVKKGQIIQVASEREEWLFGSILCFPTKTTSIYSKVALLFGFEALTTENHDCQSMVGWFHKDLVKPANVKDMILLLDEIKRCTKNEGLDYNLLQPPEKWDNGGNVQFNSKEFQTVAGFFYGTLNNKCRRFRITEIERIRNVPLWRTFVLKREMIKRQRLGHYSDHKEIERKMFHRIPFSSTTNSTDQQNSGQGFDNLFHGGHGSLFGKAAQFESHAAEIVENETKILLCRVVIGTTMSNSGKMCGSMPVMESPIAYPEYIIHFSKEDKVNGIYYC